MECFVNQGQAFWQTGIFALQISEMVSSVGTDFDDNSIESD
jgi:hypothetical protein